ncbi:TRAP transporter small permease [Dietzia sp. CH92]|uniref:TRAP transporter small permease subunit n=1 Tax=Dietzia sp. CH92 TaxID=3051823 RepID=UPI0028D552C8|nr:TRAP transporter small permease [Dietzia sp. CH92]
MRGIDRLSMSAAAIGGLTAVGLMLNVVLDVALRFLAGTPIEGTLDLTQYAWMPVLVSLGLGYALHRGEHIRVSLLTVSAGLRAQRIVEVCSLIVTVVAVVVLIWFSAERANESTHLGESAVGTAWLNIWPVRWVLVVGLVVLLLQTVVEIWRGWTMTATPPENFELGLEISGELPQVSGQSAHPRNTAQDG